jgi:dTDP-4-dehydrorhamnose reductase
MRILVLGVTGMLGHATFDLLHPDKKFEVWGTVRGEERKRFFPESARSHLISGVEVLDTDRLSDVIGQVKPDVVVNAIGLVKQLSTANDPLVVLPVNSLLPHQLANLCRNARARIIHISTDCVFSGRRGNYVEADPSDADDLYGKSKFIGELPDAPGSVTLRTSMVGHELDSKHGLVDWFLSQSGRVKGFAKAIFSGLTTNELARVIRDAIIPHPELTGVYHVGAAPIAKLELLRLVASVYQKQIDIVPDDSLVVDRSLNSARFTAATGYVAPSWPDLIAEMHRTRERTVGHSASR